MSNLILFWHRRDLRISDNIGLTQASQECQTVVGIFCLDENMVSLPGFTIVTHRLTATKATLNHAE